MSKVGKLNKTVNKNQTMNNIAQLLELKGATFVYLFGSYASDRETSESDVDIAVMFNRDTEVNFGEIKFELVQLLGKEVDLIDLRDCPIVLKHQIVTTGKIILGNVKEINTSFEYATIVKYQQYLEDIKPLKEAIKKRGFVWKK